MANDDISPGLYNRISNAFSANLDADKKAQRLANKINIGAASYKDAGDYADRVGVALQRAVSACVKSSTLPDGKLYWHIAQDAIAPMIESEFGIVSDAAVLTQEGINASAKIGLKALRAKYDKEAVNNLLGLASNAEQFDDIAVEFGESLVTYARGVVDETMKANADFQGRSGRGPMIIRRAGANCCPWCADLEGTYEYPNVPDDVYKHHDYCKCDLEYVDGYGSSSVWVNTASKEELEKRKTYGL